MLGHRLGIRMAWRCGVGSWTLSRHDVGICLCSFVPLLALLCRERSLILLGAGAGPYVRQWECLAAQLLQAVAASGL